MIKGILIGINFGDQNEVKNLLRQRIKDVGSLYDIRCYTYSIEKNKLVFDSLED